MLTPRPTPHTPRPTPHAPPKPALEEPALGGSRTRDEVRRGPRAAHGHSTVTAEPGCLRPDSRAGLPARPPRSRRGPWEPGDQRGAAAREARLAASPHPGAAALPEVPAGPESACRSPAVPQSSKYNDIPGVNPYPEPPASAAFLGKGPEGAGPRGLVPVP